MSDGSPLESYLAASNTRCPKLMQRFTKGMHVLLGSQLEAGCHGLHRLLLTGAAIVPLQLEHSLSAEDSG